MPKCPSKACGCAVITTWIIVNVLVLIMTIVNYLIPYIRIARYVEDKCRVEAYFYTNQFICSCGFTCESLYPCLIVHVSLNTTVDDNMWVVSLYKDDAQQSWVNEAAPDEQEMCSLQVCKGESQYNRMVVEEFAARYKNDIGGMIRCFYDPWQLNAGAVLKIDWPGLEVFHAVFWPTIFIVIGALACVIFCRWCRQRELMTESEGAQDDLEGKGLTAAENEKSKKEIAMEKEEEAKKQKRIEDKRIKEEKRRQKEQQKYEMQVKKNQEKAARKKLQQQKKQRQVEESVFHADTLSESEEDNEKIEVVIRDGKVDKVGKWS